MIGPTIPEGSMKKKTANESEIVISFSDEEDEQDTIGPQIPTKILESKRQEQDIGPQMPQQTAGPQIPQHILEQKRSAGPQIPPYILEQKRTAGSNSDEIAISDEEDYNDTIRPQIPTQIAGPQIPQHILKQKRSAGPQIPSHILNQKRSSGNNSDEIAISDEENISIGPQIPQHIANRPIETEEEIDPDAFAPELPPDLVDQRQKKQPQPTGRRRRPVGPSFPTGPMPPPEEEDFIVGPALPKDYNPEEEAKYSAIHAIEERARQAKEAMEKKEEDKGKVERPDWMLVPPEVDYLKKANSSRSRQFTNKTMSKEELDSAEWTMTPAQKQQLLEEQRSGKRKLTEERVDFSQLDKERIRNVQEYNMQTRPLTLLEMHQQKKKKSKDTSVEDVTKRAFDREKDLLGAKKMDRKTKKELLKQCNQLGDKFGYGSSSFL